MAQVPPLKPPSFDKKNLEPSKEVDKTTATIDDSRNNSTVPNKGLSERKTKVVLGSLRNEITDINTPEDFGFFCNKSINTLKNDFDTRAKQSLAVGELTTEQKVNKRWFTAGVSISTISAAAAVAVMVLSMTAVIPFILPVVICVAICIAVFSSVMVASSYKIATTKPDIADKTKKNIVITQAGLDLTAVEIMDFILNNKKIKDVITKLDSEQLQRLADSVVTLLENNIITEEIQELFTNISNEIQTQLDPAQKTDDENSLTRCKELMENAFFKIISNSFESTKENITDKELKKKIDEIKNDSRTKETMKDILKNFMAKFNDIKVNASLPSKDKEHIQTAKSKLIKAAEDSLKSSFERYFGSKKDANSIITTATPEKNENSPSLKNRILNFVRGKKSSIQDHPPKQQKNLLNEEDKEDSKQNQDNTGKPGFFRRLLGTQKVKPQNTTDQTLQQQEKTLENSKDSSSKKK